MKNVVNRLIRNKQYIITTISVLPVCFSGCNQEPATDNGFVSGLPNVVLINADDLGYGDAGCYGATKVKTPNIDKLAQQGCRFTDFHSASAVCSPSRYALITGRYPSRADLWGPLNLTSPLSVDTAQMTIAKIMKQAGYATAVVGKWHLGFGKDQPVDWNGELKPGPLELGFDYYFGVPVLNSSPPFVYVRNHHVAGLDPADPFVYGERAATDSFPEKMGYNGIGGAKKAHALYVDRMVGTTLKDTATRWIRNHKDERFFLYLATTNIHHPHTPAPQFVGTSDAGRYGDFIHELDWIVGEVMKTLDEEGLADNTLLILTSDNGGMLNAGGQDAWKAGHRLNGDLLGFKFDAWEGGHRVPLIARWPGKIKAGTTSGVMFSNVDMLATFAALVNYALKEGEGPDSYNALPALLGKSKKPVRDMLVISPRQKTHIAIRKGRWIYISSRDGGGFNGTVPGNHRLGGAAAHLFTHQTNSDIENGKIKDDAPPAQLYDLKKDITQQRNVYNEHPEIANELKSLLEETIQIKNQSRKE